MDEERKAQERNKVFLKKSANFMENLTVEERQYIGDYAQYCRFTNSRYFKYWDSKLQSDALVQNRGLSVSGLLTDFLKKYGLTLEQFNDINDKVEAENVSVSYVESAFAELHELGHDTIGEIDPETVINWISAQELAEGIEENACLDETIDVED
jgi:hypothetical protein